MQWFKNSFEIILTMISWCYSQTQWISMQISFILQRTYQLNETFQILGSENLFKCSDAFFPSMPSFDIENVFYDSKYAFLMQNGQKTWCDLQKKLKWHTTYCFSCLTLYIKMYTDMLIYFNKFTWLDCNFNV